jgi:WD40 repeat protein
MAALAAQTAELAPGFIFRGHVDRVWCITSHGEGEGFRLVSASEDTTVCIWDGESSRTLQHEDRVFCVRVFQDHEERWLVATLGADSVKVSR